MRLRVLSDLHLEFHRDEGRAFIAGQGDEGWDVLVLAGDVTTAAHLGEVFEGFAGVARGRPIVFVPGNHEYYGASPAGVAEVLASCRAKVPELQVLDGGVAVVEGQRFVGTTLWFPHPGAPQVEDVLLADFRQIAGFGSWVGGEARRAAAFLRETVRAGDVVVTHHLPHPGSIHPRYGTSPITRYFLHAGLDDVVAGGGAKLWIHGHTHASLDYTVGGTRVVCNPFGYLRVEENREFDERLTIAL